jgi:hypothetical protein
MEKLISIAPLAIGAAVVAVLGYQSYVTSLVCAPRTSRCLKKWLQTVIIWVLVLVGAVFSHAVLRWNPKPRHPNPFPQPDEHTGGGDTTGAPPTVD